MSPALPSCPVLPSRVAPSPLRARRRLGVAAAASAVLAAGIGTASAAPSGTAYGYTMNCPGAESLVSGTAWHAHQLAPGVVLREGTRSDANGQVRMHVLDVTLGTKGLWLKPIYRHVAQRLPLSSLAQGQKHLVAATNTGYFDFQVQAPTGPVVYRSAPLSASSALSKVVGIGTNQRAEAGSLGFAGSLRAAGQSKLLAGVNLVYPRTGFTVYTPAWGQAERVPIPRDATARYVAGGQLTYSSDSGYAPTSGFMVVARGSTAIAWLDRWTRGTSMSWSTGVSSTTSRALTQAYAVGNQLVSNGTAKSGFSCRRSHPQPARTAVGFTAGGTHLVIALVEDHPGSANPRVHGLDNNQMARLMRDLGVNQAYDWDGSGSTELLAKMPHSSHLARRTYPADGQERPMPVGFGIFSLSR